MKNFDKTKREEKNRYMYKTTLSYARNVSKKVQRVLWILLAQRGVFKQNVNCVEDMLFGPCSLQNKELIIIINHTGICSTQTLTDGVIYHLQMRGCCSTMNSSWNMQCYRYIYRAYFPTSCETLGSTPYICCIITISKFIN